MRLEIDPTRSLSEIQIMFSRAFPLLKIEFFHSPPEVIDDFSVTNKIDPFKTFAELGYRDGESGIDLNDQVTVAWLEMAFNQRFGLCVRVFRRSGDQWEKTISTQGWTLEKQNSVAIESQKTSDGNEVT